MRIGDFNQSAAVPPNVRSMAPQAAKAYGVRRTEPSGSLKLPAQVVDSFAPSQKVQGLIAGSVNAPVDFEATGRAAGGLRMYTRSADAVEAATGVELGRTIDLKA